MNLMFWDCSNHGTGTGSNTALPMTANDFASQVLADWHPTTPPIGPFFLNWYVDTLGVTKDPRDATNTDYQSVEKKVGTTERQWKAFYSWTLGVAVARQVLNALGCTWIAPMSAFYSTIAQSNGPAKKIKTKTRVSVVHMPFGLTPSSVVADAASPPTSKLRPDYIALKPDLKGGYEWYVAEAKGTDALLANYTVGTNHPWCLQAKNCEIQVNTVPQTVSRRIVVATRVNPGAVKRETRIIQARAWNSYDPSPRRLDPQAVAEMAGVHLFGLFYNLGRPAIARSIVDALDAFGERSGRKRKVPDLERRRANEDAVRSIEQLPRQFRSRGFASTTEVRLPVETREGVADVWLNPAFTDLALQFISADSAEEVAEAVTEAEGQLSASADRDALLTSAGSSDYRIPRGVSVDLPDIRESRRPFSR